MVYITSMLKKTFIHGYAIGVGRLKMNGHTLLIRPAQYNNYCSNSA